MLLEDGVRSSPVILDSDSIATVPQHPLGVKPAGNSYTAQFNCRNASGLFGLLADEQINQILEHLNALELIRLGSTCKALYAFSRFEELWKALLIESSLHKSFVWYGTWRNTYLQIPEVKASKICCKGLFSDLLYRPFYCANISLEPFINSIPNRNSIPRHVNLTSVEFLSHWSDKPFIMTGFVKKWPISTIWSRSYLLDRYGNICFRAEAVDWPLRTYYEYMENNGDESPLYLFDRSFVEKMGLLVGDTEEAGGDYWIPECFGKDFFETLGGDRPDSRWLIIGPERSGSTFHKDPNATSAWNAVLKGAKYWIMFPSSDTTPPPPGVFVSEDQAEVTSPLSIAEWLLGFHADARKTKGCLEGICYEGELLHVPSGWWHLVVNLAPSIAITQNFIPRTHLAATLLFLRDKPNQVSGFKESIKDPYQTFVERMRKRHPGPLEGAYAELAELKNGKKRKWDDIARGAEDAADGGISGFSFGFGGDDTDEVEVP